MSRRKWLIKVSLEPLRLHIVIIHLLLEVRVEEPKAAAEELLKPDSNGRKSAVRQRSTIQD